MLFLLVCILYNCFQVILCGDSSCSRLEGSKWEEVAQLTEKRFGNGKGGNGTEGGGERGRGEGNEEKERFGQMGGNGPDSRA